MRIPLVQVGHRRNKPAINHPFGVVFRSIWIKVHLFNVTGFYILVQVVKPILAGNVFHPYVIAAAVIKNHIHHHTHTLCMRLVNQAHIILVSTETRIHTVIIRCGITVIRTTLHIVFENRIQPDGSHPQILNIVQMLFDTGQVAAMTCTRIVTVGFVGSLHHQVIV